MIDCLLSSTGLYQVEAQPFPWPWVYMRFAPFASALLLAVLLTALLIKIAPRYGWVAVPRQDRWSVRVVAQFGGIPFLVAASAAALFFFPARENLVLLVLTWGTALIGFTDDIAKLPPRGKLLGQALMAGLAVYAGIVLPLTTHFWINAAVTVFWIVGITNSLNLLDNMDGLAAGIAIIAAAQIVLLAGPFDPLRGLALCLLAAIAGFLIFNVNPAKVFMGDVGALSIGFFLACACVKVAEPAASGSAALLLPCLILFVPLFDTLLVSVTRRAKRRPISMGGRDHASHRLVWIGLNERQAVALLWVIGGVAGLMGFLSRPGWDSVLAGVVAFFLLGSTLFWVYLARLELPPDWLSSGEGRVAAVPKRLQHITAAIFFILIDGAAIALALYFAYLARFRRLDNGILAAFFVTAVLAVFLKIPLLAIFSAVARKWGIQGKWDVYPILACAISAASLLALTGVLLKSRAIESSVIFFDAVFTVLLLALCRNSASAFDSLLGRHRLLDQPGPEQSLWPQLGPAASQLLSPADRLVTKKTPAEDPGLNQRSN